MCYVSFGKLETFRDRMILLQVLPVSKKKIEFAHKSNGNRIKRPTIPSNLSALYKLRSFHGKRLCEIDFPDSLISSQGAFVIDHLCMTKELN